MRKPIGDSVENGINPILFFYSTLHSLKSVINKIKIMSNNENQEKLLNLLNDKDSLLIEYTKSYERLKQAKYLTKFLNIYIAIGIILILFIYYKENLIESGIISITLLMTISAFIMNKVKSNLFDRCTDILKKYDDKIDEINNFLKNISNEG
jgi:hypothetical protein